MFGEQAVMLAGILAGARRDLGRQKVHDQAVLVGRPYAAVMAQETGAGAFLAAKAARAVKQARDEPLEADRHLTEPLPQLFHYPVDYAAADQRLANRGCGRPVRAMRQQIGDRNRQIMIGVDQPGRGRDDAVSIRVRVVGEGDAYRSLRATSRAIAQGLEQSMRILPS